MHYSNSKLVEFWYHSNNFFYRAQYFLQFGFPLLYVASLLWKPKAFKFREIFLTKLFDFRKNLGRWLKRKPILLDMKVKFVSLVNDIVLQSLLLALGRFHTLFWCFHCWLWLCKYQLARHAGCSEYNISLLYIFLPVVGSISSRSIPS